MSLHAQALQKFCNEYKLDFPDFTFVYGFGTHCVTCNITWYGYVITSQMQQTHDAAIKSAIELCSNWVQSEINFIRLLTLANNKMVLY
jgi:hypothetical protein